eukprot:1161564-Pelagomonas_calceolata.AAC.2
MDSGCPSVCLVCVGGLCEGSDALCSPPKSALNTIGTPRPRPHQHCLFACVSTTVIVREQEANAAPILLCNVHVT